METSVFIQALQERVSQIRRTVTENFASLDIATLNYKPGPDSWSILECLEHLNRYCRFYLPQLSKAIAAAPAVARPGEFSSGWLGRKIVDSVDPKNIRKQKTFKHLNPNNSRLTKDTLTEFMQHQETLLQLLEQSGRVDLNKKAVPVEFFRLLKIRIGVAFLFLVTHQERHIGQALRVKFGQVPVNVLG
jgi:hypothetical protein